MGHPLHPLHTMAGVTENQLHPGTGLRNMGYHAIVTSDLNMHVSAVAIGGAIGADVGGGNTFVDIPLDEQARATIPATLCFHVDQTAATPALAGTVRFQVKGIDQYGMPQIETTPVVALVAKANNQIYLSKIFSSVSSIGYQSTLIDESETLLNVGQRWDWTQTNDAATEHLHGLNLGLPLFGWSRNRAQGVANPARFKLQGYDGPFSSEVGRILTVHPLIPVYQNPTVAMGIADAADWEASIDKIRLTSAVTWAVTDVVHVFVPHNVRSWAFDG